jgi:hypothetical protein
MAIDVRSGMSAALAALLVGCSGGLQQDNVMKQVDDALSDDRIACPVSADYEGVTEGDADTAYITVSLRRREAGAGHPAREVELMYVHHDDGQWSMTDDSSRALAVAANEVCGR